MSVEPVTILVSADLRIPRVATGWRELEPVLLAQPGLRIVAFDDGRGIDFASFADSVELLLVLGGDGAILRACRQLGERQIPILGVNFGRLGFLADLSLEELREQIAIIVHRQFRVVQHLMFQCTVLRSEVAPQTFLGLNEVVVSSGASLRMIDVHLAINDEQVTTYSGDGLIVSTPVGSTAHSLSAGGPILRQDLQAFVITPICSHALTNRPLVDSADCVYTLGVPDIPLGTTLVIDGQIRLPLISGDVIEVRRAPVSFQLVKFPGSSYYATLYRKLGWGGQPHYRAETPQGG